MRTTRRTTIDLPSLFPFLSVLVCLIGVLIFLVAAVAPASVESASSNMELVIEAKGARHDKSAVILDCTADGAHTLDGSLTFTADAERKAPRADGSRGTPFTNFLNDIASRGSKEYVLFVVRPDGLNVFRTLRAVIIQRNLAAGEKSVQVSEEPQPLRAALAQAGARYAGGRLYFTGRMDASLRDELKSLFSQKASKNAVDTLFEQTQSVPPAVSYGTELLPAGWRLRASSVAQTPEPDTGVTPQR